MFSAVEIKEKAKENDKRLLKKVGDYLMSDSYMYAPLVVPPTSLFTLSKGTTNYTAAVSLMSFLKIWCFEECFHCRF